METSASHRVKHSDRKVCGLKKDLKLMWLRHEVTSTAITSTSAC